MYNGIGLASVRGTATSGHVQANAGHVRNSSRRNRTFRNANDGRDENRNGRLGGRGGGFLDAGNERHTLLTNEALREGASALALHEKKRQLEIRLMVLRDQLEERGWKDDDIDTEIAHEREKLRREAERREHQLSQQQQQQQQQEAELDDGEVKLITQGVTDGDANNVDNIEGETSNGVAEAEPSLDKDSKKKMGETRLSKIKRRYGRTEQYKESGHFGGKNTQAQNAFQEQRNERLRDAFGIRAEKHKEGEAFDRELQEAKKLEKKLVKEKAERKAERARIRDEKRQKKLKTKEFNDDKSGNGSDTKKGQMEGTASSSSSRSYSSSSSSGSSRSSRSSSSYSSSSFSSSSSSSSSTSNSRGRAKGRSRHARGQRRRSYSSSSSSSSSRSSISSRSSSFSSRSRSRSVSYRRDQKRKYGRDSRNNLRSYGESSPPMSESPNGSRNRSDANAPHEKSSKGGTGRKRKSKSPTRSDSPQRRRSYSSSRSRSSGDRGSYTAPPKEHSRDEGEKGGTRMKRKRSRSSSYSSDSRSRGGNTSNDSRR